jgi:hypothetical protein
MRPTREADSVTTPEAVPLSIAERLVMGLGGLVVLYVSMRGLLASFRRPPRD